MWIMCIRPQDAYLDYAYAYGKMLGSYFSGLFITEHYDDKY